ncbi:MAG: hypothetical protein AAF845_01025 [Bacteroidota bacterium]
MLHTVLAGVLAGTLALGTPDTGDDKKTASDPDKAVAEDTRTPGVFDLAAEEAEVPNHTYAQGRSSAAVPIKFWAQYSIGQTNDIYDRQGESQRLSFGGPVPLGTVGESLSQRIQIGTQIDVVSLPSVRLGAGALLGIAKTNFTAETPGALGIGDLESPYGLQQLRVWGSARGDVVGVHAGYSFDLGNALVAGEPIPAFGGARLATELPNSDGRDAIFAGLDFDYPSERFRLLGGIDYFALQAGGASVDASGNEIEGTEVEDGGDWLNFLFGGGVRFPVFELGATFQIQTRFDEPLTPNIGTVSGIGGHVGRIVPYARISPASLPASLYIKGAVPDEYFDYGYTLGGSNAPNPTIGFTAGLSIGFE